MISLEARRAVRGCCYKAGKLSLNEGVGSGETDSASSGLYVGNKGKRKAKDEYQLPRAGG